MAKTIRAASGHTLHISEIAASDLPSKIERPDNFNKFYEVRNWEKTGPIMMYLGKGHKDAPKQVVAWYKNGKMWMSYGVNLETAVNGAQKDGWLYAE